MLEPQLHLSPISVDLVPHVAAVENRQFIKPAYGFWTSTYIDESSGWVDWCRSEDFGDPSACNWYVLVPDPAARIYTINSAADLNALLQDYRDPRSFHALVYPDFERISEVYDAIHLTGAGQYATRHSQPGLYGWDCESTLWFRWCFTSYARVRASVPA